ncbi:DNA protecting protein DprA [Comamonas serinivorans]|uniref:DNA protecting protein DprA n=1 Tax=Comamonas serinivorans TaxID=1082851 RepID=A0A1Y0ERU9_9BURK|nr:DNA-processing protein DprA [Comamonas serinivorans]ARU06394.1 DNA protecting protein DprA [Comamonas serinivorans]
MDTDELRLWLRLLHTPGIGNHAARKLLAALGLPEHIFAAPASVLDAVVGPKQAQALKREPDDLPQRLATCQDWLAASARDGLPRTVLSLADARYPACLLQIEDPPPVLFVLGDLARLARHDPRQSLAIVGSRNPTPQGSQTARAFARHLAQQGLTIVSGLAHGIDAAAHAGALEAAAAPVPTLALVGTGLDRVYPRQNQALARDVAQRGLLLSEFAPGTPPLPSNFPKRNRLIAGLSRGTLVVEAALQSGSLITARLAGEQGKDVFAIPGSIHGTQSRGCHALIREGARLVESVQDILDEWSWQSAPSTVRPPDGAPDGDGRPGTATTTTQCSASMAITTAPDAEDDELLRAMGADPIGLDALQARTGWPTPQLQARLLELELEGRVGRLPGQLFQALGLG